LELSGCGVERASLLVFLRLKTWGGGKILPPPELKPGGAIAPAAPPVSYAYDQRQYIINVIKAI